MDEVAENCSKESTYESALAKSSWKGKGLDGVIAFENVG